MEKESPKVESAPEVFFVEAQPEIIEIRPTPSPREKWPQGLDAVTAFAVLIVLCMVIVGFAVWASSGGKVERPERAETTISGDMEITTVFDADGTPIRRTSHPIGKVFPSVSGPLSASGKLHGEGRFATVDEATGTIRTVPFWFWYGEEVTEGEWHLRERGISR